MTTSFILINAIFQFYVLKVKEQKISPHSGLFIFHHNQEKMRNFGHCSFGDLDSIGSLQKYLYV